MANAAEIPYCGAPPVPDALWRSWNLDPVLIAALLAIAGAYGLGLSRLRAAERPEPWRRASFCAGWSVLALALISPLCSLSVALFAARVGQHMLLTLVAAPLIVLGRPVFVLAELFPACSDAMRRAASVRPFGRASLCFALFTGFLWLWHAPGPYAITFESTVAYWTMHVTLIGSALMLWRVLLDASPAGALKGLACSFASTMQMSLLGALLTFSSRPIYAPHLATTWPWGLTPLDDQQLGGLIMWVPGCTVLAVAGVFCAGVWLARFETARPLRVGAV
jgi:putative membrane protein